jgi:hypothetical protein
MKTYFTASLIVFISLTVYGQVTKKQLELPEFRSVYNNSNYTVYLKQTNKQEVSVEALTDIYELTNIFVENGVLMINVERKPENTNKSIWAKIDDIKLNPTMKIYISMKNIHDVQVNGSGKVIAENSLASNNLNLSIGGSGSMDMDVKGDFIKAEVSGSGKMIIKGYASSLEGVVSGSGSIHAFSCPLDKAKIKVSGSGLAELNVTDNIEATVVGSGSVKHKGNTKQATKKVYGSGSIDRAY